MKYLLIVDLMGTLLEATQVVLVDKSRQLLMPDTKHYFDEYKSRISYISRKLNTFLENNNRICLVTSVDHCSQDQELHIIKDIDKSISDHNKDRINYFLTNYEDLENVEINNRIAFTQSRKEAYDLSIDNNRGCYFITIDDDLINAPYVSKVIDLGGQYIHIDNMLNSRGWSNNESYWRVRRHYHMDDNIDGLVEYYKRCSTLFLESLNGKEFSKFLGFSKEEIYLKLLSNKLDIDGLFSWLAIRDIQKSLYDDSGYSFHYIQELINHKCIQIYPSFEQAYQKVLIPKIKEQHKLKSCR